MRYHTRQHFSIDLGLFPERVVLLYGFHDILRPRTMRYYTNIILLELCSGTCLPTGLARLSTTLQGKWRSHIIKLIALLTGIYVIPTVSKRVLSSYTHRVKS